MTAAGVPATDDSGRVRRGGHCAAGRHYDCSGHLGCDCECHSEPTPARPESEQWASVDAQYMDAKYGANGIGGSPTPTRPGTADEDLVAGVANWLAKEYGELLNPNPADAPPGYWEFQARELLTDVPRLQRLLAVEQRAEVLRQRMAEAAYRNGFRDGQRSALGGGDDA